MPHRIVVLGAGYAGTFAAGLLARHLHTDDATITVVNAEPDFVERLRLHQLAAGQHLRRQKLSDVFAGTGIRLRLGRVTAVDARQQAVTVTGGDGADRIEYDTLLYTLGSTIAGRDIPGVDAHAFHIASRPAALRLRHRLDELGDNAKVLVVGGNLTAIEGATEIAESHPGLRVELATTGRVGAWLSPKARRHLRQAFDRFGIGVFEHTTVTRVTDTGAIAADGTEFSTDATVWAAGFAVHPIAADGGITVEGDGRIAVDRTMRSVSHPQIYAAGDSAHVIGANGRPLPMSCASAGATAMQATSAIIAELTGRQVSKTALRYVGNHISLGRRDAIAQLVDADTRSRSWALRGRGAARVKAAILAGAAWTISHPTYGLPRRKRRLPASRQSHEAVTA